MTPVEEQPKGTFMFLQLFSIEWTRLTRRALFWVTLAVCAAYTGFSLANFYGSNSTELLTGKLKMPGAAFDLASSLDQLMIVIPFLVIISANVMGNDYSQRTNQHWLMRAPRVSSLAAKFCLLILMTLGVQVLALLVGGLVGWYYKTQVYHVSAIANINWPATLAAPFYMTLTTLPYLALALALAVMLRSTFLSVVLGLGYTQFVELVLGAMFYGAGWTKWLFTNLHFSASFVLNSIGNRSAELPSHILSPGAALVTAAIYTLILLALAAGLYRRQDVGG
jgi:hypothetical protein